jgi:uncharacterized membrane protein
MHGGMGFWPLIPLFWIGVIMFFGCMMRRRFSRRNRYWQGPMSESFEPNAMEILRRRYARGEIDGTTFDQMRERLESSGRPKD